MHPTLPLFGSAAATATADRGGRTTPPTPTPTSASASRARSPPPSSLTPASPASPASPARHTIRRAPSMSKYTKAGSGSEDPEKGLLDSVDGLVLLPVHVPASPTVAVAGLRGVVGRATRTRRARLRGLLGVGVVCVCWFWLGGGAGEGERRARGRLIPSPADFSVNTIAPPPVADAGAASPSYFSSDPSNSSSSSHPLLSNHLLHWHPPPSSLHPPALIPLFAPVSPAPPAPPTPLGPHADSVYALGPRSWSALQEALRAWVDAAAPESVRAAYAVQAQARWGAGTGTGTEDGGGDVRDDIGAVRGRWDGAGNKIVWQVDKDDGRVGTREVGTWREGQAKGEGWEWEMVTDAKAEVWILNTLKGSLLERLWFALPSGILRSDYLRYLLLALHGGIYTDTDTILLQPPSAWVRPSDVDLWRGGEGWLPAHLLARLEDAFERGGPEARRQAEEEVMQEIPVGAVIGIEADVGDRADWAEWWPRPLQIAQWTMAMAPLHPIPLLALQRIAQNTAYASEWSASHLGNITALLDRADALTASGWSLNEDEEEDEDDTDVSDDDDPSSAFASEPVDPLTAARTLAGSSVLSEPSAGGPLGIVNWSGPGVWTDAVLTYLYARYGLRWTDLRGLSRPLRVGDVVVLPVTGFSPGVGNFGAGWVGDPLAMVEHSFRGSWKHD